MPTPSDSASARATRWAPQAAPARSVFPNFKEQSSVNSEFSVPIVRGPLPAEDSSPESALGRAYLYAYLSRAFEDPDARTWDWLNHAETLSMLEQAARQAHSAAGLDRTVAALTRNLERACLEEFSTDYITAFGHAARGRCPMNEIEYGDPQADPLFQPHRLADLAAFYRAFGLEVAGDASERQDHLCIELEFMSVLAAKEAFAATADPGATQICRDAQRKFLREHLGRWSVAFAGRLEREVGQGPLAVLACLLRDFVRAECKSFSVPVGDDILPLRPTDEAEENLCASCGIHNALPGVMPPAAGQAAL